MKANTTTFQPGQQLTARSICDYECIYAATVIKRTAKTVTIEEHGEQKTIKVHTDERGDFCYPHGHYSMCAIFRAPADLVPASLDPEPLPAEPEPEPVNVIPFTMAATPAPQRLAIADLKAWLSKNLARGVVSTSDQPKWYPLDGAEFDGRVLPAGMSMAGLWELCDESDEITAYADDEGMIGLRVFNGKKSWMVAVPPVGWAFVPNWMMPHAPAPAWVIAAPVPAPEPERPVYQDKPRRTVQQSLFDTEGLFQLR